MYFADVNKILKDKKDTHKNKKLIMFFWVKYFILKLYLLFIALF